MGYKHLDGPVTPTPDLLRAALKEAAETWRKRANDKVAENQFRTLEASDQDWLEFARLRREAIRLEAMAEHAGDMVAALARTEGENRLPYQETWMRGSVDKARIVWDRDYRAYRVTWDGKEVTTCNLLLADVRFESGPDIAMTGRPLPYDKHEVGTGIPVVRLPSGIYVTTEAGGHSRRVDRAGHLLLGTLSVRKRKLGLLSWMRGSDVSFTGEG
jgi:hypothetical protein